MLSSILVCLICLLVFLAIMAPYFQINGTPRGALGNCVAPRKASELDPQRSLWSLLWSSRSVPVWKQAL